MDLQNVKHQPPVPCAAPSETKSKKKKRKKKKKGENEEKAENNPIEEEKIPQKSTISTSTPYENYEEIKEKPQTQARTRLVPNIDKETLEKQRLIVCECMKRIDALLAMPEKSSSSGDPKAILEDIE